MGNNNEVNIQTEMNGTITFANEVIATIAGLAAMDIPGVAGMCGSLAGGFAELLGRKNLAKGVKIQVEDNVVTVDIELIVDYGAIVPEVCKEVQQSVSKALETMTGLNVAAINITVQGVKMKEIAEAEE